MSNPEEPSAHEQLWALATNPTMRRCLSTIESVAGFRLRPEQCSSFLRYHAYITTKPAPQYITELRSSGRRYDIHVNGILGDAQNALACVYYHLMQLERMETAVEQLVESSGVREIMGESVVAVGNTLGLDFEYQAFILAIRRCLDYSTRALASYFKNDFHSFRRFGNFLDNATPAVVAARLREAHGRHVARFDFAVSASERHSTRDRITHYEFVPAGVVNVSKRGFVLAGGGENLHSQSGDSPRPLRQVLQSYAARLQSCIDDLLDTFITASRAYENRLPTNRNA